MVLYCLARSDDNEYKTALTHTHKIGRYSVVFPMFKSTKYSKNAYVILYNFLTFNDHKMLNIISFFNFKKYFMCTLSSV